jgi:8-hydroxy-5-deazaflavin:NADPH oxidoreductase
MTTAIIGTGTLGSAIARHLASGGEPLRLSSGDKKVAAALAEQLGPDTVLAEDNHDALTGVDAVILALRFTVLDSVLAELAESLKGQVVVVPSNPVTSDANGNVIRVLKSGESSGLVVAGWLPQTAHLAMAFGTMSVDLLDSSSKRSPDPAVLFYATDDSQAGREVDRLIRVAGFEPEKVGGLKASTRLEVNGDLHDVVVSSTQGRSLIGDPDV